MMQNGELYLKNFLSFWKDRLEDCLVKDSFTPIQKLEYNSFKALLNSNAPFELWGQCQSQSGFISQETIDEVKRIDEAIFKIYYCITSSSKEECDSKTNNAIIFESILVFCLCSALRKQGRLVE